MSARSTAFRTRSPRPIIRALPYPIQFQSSRAGAVAASPGLRGVVAAPGAKLVKVVAAPFRRSPNCPARRVPAISDDQCIVRMAARRPEMHSWKDTSRYRHYSMDPRSAPTRRHSGNSGANDHICLNTGAFVPTITGWTNGASDILLR